MHPRHLTACGTYRTCQAGAQRGACPGGTGSTCQSGIRQGCAFGIASSARNRQEAVPYEQCRQPRRGGTGGEELRRLRWSSPPGQGEPVPPGTSPPQGATAAKTISAANGLMQGCRGRSPRRNKLKNLPLPAGEGGWGSILPLRGRGAKRQAKGRVGGRQRGQAPRRVPLTLAETATPGASPPPGTTAAKTISAAGG